MKDNVVDLFKKKEEKKLSKSRIPLIMVNSHLNPKETEDSGSRMERIKKSLEKIHQLITEIKQKKSTD